MDIRILKTIRYLEENASARLTVRELANRVELSESRLQHLFKSEVLLTIRAFIRLQRLHTAAHLITSTDERISQICFAVGFTDVSNFDHVFKREFGVSPREFRRDLQNGAADSNAVAERRPAPEPGELAEDINK